MWSRTFTASLACLVTAAAVVLVGPGGATAAPVTPHAVPTGAPAVALGAHDADLLAAAQGRGDRRVTLIIAAERGDAADVAAGVRRIGGTVARRFDGVGYLLAEVPTTRVLAAARLAGVAAVDLDERLALPEPTVDGVAGRRAAAADPAPPGVTTGAANPYLPTHEIGSVSFKTRHPEWDGRGVTVGIMDSGVDLDHPALRTTSTGQRKIVDWVTATDPLLDDDGTWRPMVTEVTGPTFDYAGQRWRAPAGTWRVSRFAESVTAQDDPAGDVNFDGDTTDTFGVLYDPVSHDIRVDDDADRDFTDEKAMRPYREGFDVGYFGVDDPETAIAERMPFVVEYREDVDLTPAGLPGRVTDFVNIGIPESPHGTHVAGIVAGRRLLNAPQLDGQAPGARIVSSRACSWGGGCTASALTTGMVDLVVNRRVDVVNMSIGGLPALNDANNARARLYDELIDEYGVQLFVSAGNSGPGANTVGDPSVAGSVVSVAASVSRDTWLVDYGAVVTRPNAVFNFSSRGPREDGGFKPDIVAPGAAISTTNTWLAGEPVPEAGYPLPPGYAMFNGTSMAAPQATGGAALLLSAAKATDRAVTPAALRRALYTAARLIPDTGVYAQGNGMMDVEGTWDLLAAGVETRDYTATAPVCTPISRYLATPHTGVGIYNRCAAGSGGQRAGRSKAYTVRLTRTSGPDRPVRHRLRWIGDAGFTSAADVDLPLDVTVPVPVVVTPTGGVNSAILHVDDPDTAVVDFEVLNTVLVGAAPTRPQYAVTTDSTVQRNSTASTFVTVPEGATALQVNLSGIATGSQTRFIAVDPLGVPAESTSSLACYTNRPVADCRPNQRVYADPLPGVWELEVEARRTTASLDNPFRLTARVLGVAVTPEVIEVPTVTAGRPTPVSWRAENRFGPVVVTGRGGPLGSAAARRPSIGDGEELTYSVDVPAGTQRLAVSIGEPGDPAADLDLSVLYGDRLVGRSADGDSEEAVSVPRPAAGTYTVVVEGYAVPAGETRFDYLDVFFSRSLGEVTVRDTPVELENGASTTVTGTVVATAAPADGRRLFGQLSIVTDAGATVGGAAVVIGAVERAGDDRS